MSIRKFAAVALLLAGLAACSTNSDYGASDNDSGSAGLGLHASSYGYGYRYYQLGRD